MNVTLPGNTVAEIWLPLPASKYKLTIDGRTVKGKVVDGKFVTVTMNDNALNVRIVRTVIQ